MDDSLQDESGHGEEEAVKTAARIRWWKLEEELRKAPGGREKLPDDGKVQLKC